MCLAPKEAGRVDATMTTLRALLLTAIVFLPAASFAQPPQRDLTVPTPDMNDEVAQLRSALVRLPLAAILASVLAVRPRRRGTPNRKPPVIETQIILAVVGAVVMLVVGSSLARAFGIV